MDLDLVESSEVDRPQYFAATWTKRLGAVKEAKERAERERREEEERVVSAKACGVVLGVTSGMRGGRKTKEQQEKEAARAIDKEQVCLSLCFVN